MVQKLLEYNQRIKIYKAIIEEMEQARSMQALRRKYRNYLSRDTKIAQQLKEKFKDEFLKGE